jgi:hypothetical protein
MSSYASVLKFVERARKKLERVDVLLRMRGS